MSWRNWFKSTYTLSLEAERDRLLAELRLWQDAALIREGLPKLTPQAAKELPKTKARMLPSIWRSHLESRHLEKDKSDA